MIGRELLALKDRIGHGNFTAWIEAEFGMSRHTANRFMNVAEVYGSKSSSVQHLDSTALYELAAPKTPIEVREEIERMIGSIGDNSDGRLDMDAGSATFTRGGSGHARIQFFCNPPGGIRWKHIDLTDLVC